MSRTGWDTVRVFETNIMLRTQDESKQAVPIFQLGRVSLGDPCTLFRVQVDDVRYSLPSLPQPGRSPAGLSGSDRAEKRLG